VVNVAIFALKSIRPVQQP